MLSSSAEMKGYLLGAIFGILPEQTSFCLGADFWLLDSMKDYCADIPFNKFSIGAAAGVVVAGTWVASAKFTLRSRTEHNFGW